METYHSIVPAALGSDPTVATDYPLYPGQYNYNHNHNATGSTFNATYNPNHTYNNNNATLASTLGGVSLGRAGLAGAAAAPLNLSLPPPRFPAATAAGAQGRPSSGSHALMQQQPDQYHQRAPTAAGLPSEPPSSSSGAFLKTYANSAYVPPDATDAYAQRDNFNGSYSTHRRRLGPTSLHSGQSTDGAAAPAGGGGQQQQQQHGTASTAAGSRVSEAYSSAAAATGRPSLPSQQHPLPPLGPPRGAGPSGSLYGGGDSGGGGGAALGGPLNGTLNGTLNGRRSGLPPLASYTSVTNTAAPTSALNSSMRTIPVNAAFNSSLRPPPSHAQAHQGRTSERP
jgi:hypothetical protein